MFYLKPRRENDVQVLKHVGGKAYVHTQNIHAVLN